MRIWKGLALGVPALLLAGLALEPVAAAEALVTNQVSDNLSFVDLGTMKSVADIAIGGKPAGIALSADRKTAYITAPEGQELIEVDAVARTVKRRLKLGGGPLGVAAHPTKAEVYVADWYTHQISVVDTSAFVVVAQIAVGKSPSGLAVTPDGATLISADRDSDQVSLIDLSTRKVTATIATGQHPFGVTIDAEGRRAFTANVTSDDVSVIDLKAQKVVATLKVGHRPYAIEFANGHGFTTDQGVGTITVFDATTLAVETTIEACDHPEGIEAAGDGKSVYVACWGDNVLLKVDAETLLVAGKAPVGDGPRAFGKFLR